MGDKGVFQKKLQPAIKVGKSVLQCLDMVKFVHAQGIVDQSTLRQAPIRNISRHAEMFCIPFEQIDEESDSLAHVNPF